MCSRNKKMFLEDLSVEGRLSRGLTTPLLKAVAEKLHWEELQCFDKSDITPVLLSLQGCQQLDAIHVTQLERDTVLVCLDSK